MLYSIGRGLTVADVRRVSRNVRTSSAVLCETGFYHETGCDSTYLEAFFRAQSGHLTGRYRARALRLAGRFDREAARLHGIVQYIRTRADAGT